MELEERVAALEAKVDMIIRELGEIKSELRRRNNYLKYLTTIYIATLSFLAAVLGVVWKP